MNKSHSKHISETRCFREEVNDICPIPILDYFTNLILEILKHTTNMLDFERGHYDSPVKNEPAQSENVEEAKIEQESLIESVEKAKIEDKNLIEPVEEQTNQVLTQQDEKNTEDSSGQTNQVLTQQDEKITEDSPQQKNSPETTSRANIEIIVCDADEKIELVEDYFEEESSAPDILIEQDEIFVIELPTETKDQNEGNNETTSEKKIEVLEDDKLRMEEIKVESEEEASKILKEEDQKTADFVVDLIKPISTEENGNQNQSTKKNYFVADNQIKLPKSIECKIFEKQGKN